MPSSSAHALTQRLVIGLAAAKLIVGLATLTAADGAAVTLVRAAVAFEFAVVALLLLIGGRDARSRTLGVVFLLVASVFADALPGQMLEQDASWPSGTLKGLFVIEVDALTPYFLWRFALDFPRVTGLRSGQRRVRRILTVSGVVGAILIAANVFRAVTEATGRLELFAALQPLARESGVVYWIAQLVLSSAALLAIVRRTDRALADERRRVALLVWGLTIGTAPTLLWLLLVNLVPGAMRVLPFEYAAWVIYPTLLSTPLTTAYAVLVRHALDVRLVVRRALQYALARYSLIALATVPAASLVVVLYRERDASIAQVVTRSDTLLFLVLTVVAVLLLRGRRGVLERLDHRFFRAQYDARATLTALVDGCRAAVTSAELAHVLRTQIDGALRLESATVLLLDEERRQFVAPDGRVRPLSVDSAVARRLAQGTPSLDVEEDGVHPPDPTSPIVEDDRHWLVDAGARLLLPLRAADRSLAGIVALGDKKSDLPYSAEDRMLLGAVMAAAELTLAPLAGRVRAIATGDDASDARSLLHECLACGALHDLASDLPPTACGRCGAALQTAALPRAIGDRFRLESRIGAGGMGVVYRATDLALGRAVALKTLPQLGPGEALRLRREARAMATVSHPNLALIFGVESWHGRPILVCEYLGGGTLAERLAHGPLPPPAVATLGVALAEALAAIHAAGLLHRDVKPTNIGFADDGRAKLLDFGLARMLDVARAAHGNGGEWTDADGRDRTLHASFSETGSVLLGTPAYMAPEAIVGEPPTAAFDLWSLGVVLYEAAVGRHPFRAADGTVHQHRILAAAAPDPRAVAPVLPHGLAASLRRALARDPSERYASAAELGADLRTLLSATTTA